VPAPTDHEVRRREVARAAVHSIARDGLEGATLRAVADEGGWSVGVVQHYFRNKSQLLAAAVDYLAEKTSATLHELSSAPSALHQLTELLRDIVPEPRSPQAQYWRVWVCFWAQATNDPLLARAVEEQARSWRERLAATIRAGQADGSMRADLSPEDEAAYLAAVIDGLGVTTAVDSDAPKMTDTVERLVTRLSAAKPRQPVSTNSAKAR
jgi:TetR/AcrR family transcriptional repressor of bet genes